MMKKSNLFKIIITLVLATFLVANTSVYADMSSPEAIKKRISLETNIKHKNKSQTTVAATEQLKNNKGNTDLSKAENKIIINELDVIDEGKLTKQDSFLSFIPLFLRMLKWLMLVLGFIVLVYFIIKVFQSSRIQSPTSSAPTDEEQLSPKESLVDPQLEQTPVYIYEEPATLSDAVATFIKLKFIK